MLTHIADQKINCLGELLPWKWQKACKSTAVTPGNTTKLTLAFLEQLVEEIPVSIKRSLRDRAQEFFACSARTSDRYNGNRIKLPT